MSRYGAVDNATAAWFLRTTLFEANRLLRHVSEDGAGVLPAAAQETVGRVRALVEEALRTVDQLGRSIAWAHLKSALAVSGPALGRGGPALEGVAPLSQLEFDGEAAWHGLADTAPAARDAALRDRLDSLTPREREVMRYMVAGLSNKELARVLSISPRTAEIHRARVLQKMGATNIVDLIWMSMSVSEAA